MNSGLPVDNVLVEAMCLMEALRRLGFSDQDLYVMLGGLADAEAVHSRPVFVGLTRAGKPVFTVHAGVVLCSRTGFRGMWESAAAAWADAPEEVLQAAWAGSAVYEGGKVLIKGLLENGIFPPCIVN